MDEDYGEGVFYTYATVCDCCRFSELEDKEFIAECLLKMECHLPEGEKCPHGKTEPDFGREIDKRR